MSIEQKKKILFISHEFHPYHSETNFAKIITDLAILSNTEGYEVRAIMPRFGSVNERRHKLHEVVRLSGINITVDNEDYPLIIKVASIPNARLQIYFMDNEDMFKRKSTFHDDKGDFYEDNIERVIFFCKSALETVKKFGWPPDVVHIHGWMSSLIPMYIKSYYKKEPVFANSKLVYSITKNSFSEKMADDFLKKILASTPLKEKDLDAFTDGSNTAMYLGGAKNADVVLMADEEIEVEITNSVKTSKTKKVLKFDSELAELDTIIELYNNLCDK